MRKESIAESACVLLGEDRAPVWLIQPVDDHDLAGIQREYDAIRQQAGEESFLLIALPVSQWNRDLSPWEAPPVFGAESFGDGAVETLRLITDRLIPALRRETGGSAGRRIYLGGYSLAGLFALWAGYVSGAFSGVAAVSPSVWFPGWEDFAARRMPHAGAVYLSLGDREERTRNPVMARVGDRIRAQHALLTEQRVPCALEWNPGNHFKDPDLRTAKGFAWLIRHAGEASSRVERRASETESRDLNVD